MCLLFSCVVTAAGGGVSQVIDYSSNGGSASSSLTASDVTNCRGILLLPPIISKGADDVSSKAIASKFGRFLINGITAA